MKRLGIILITLVISFKAFAFEYSLGLSTSIFNSNVYLINDEYSNGFDFEYKYLTPFEVINYYRFSLSLDTKFAWLESGLSVSGLSADSIVSAFGTDVCEYQVYLSGLFKLPAKYGIFTFFPMIGIEWSHLILMTAGGNNVTDQLSSELKSHLNHRFSLKTGFGIDIDITKKMYVRIWGTLGWIWTDPNWEYSAYIEPVLTLNPELNGYYIESQSNTTIIGVMYGYRFNH